MRCFHVVSWIGVAALAVAAPLVAHDLWIEPARFTALPDQPLSVSLHVGHPGAGGFDAVRRDPSRWERFALAGPSGESEIPGLDGSTPAGVIRPENPGRYVVVLRSRDAVSRLSAERFHDYLIEEGLEHIADLRQRRGEEDEPGVELYSRALKTLVTVTPDGTAPPGPADRPLGLRLELVAETDPARAAPDELLRFRLLFEGEPLGKALVEARHLDEPSRELSGRTDADGRVSFPLDVSGPWLITAVHMVEAPPDREARWQSIWAALTFERWETTRSAR